MHTQFTKLDAWAIATVVLAAQGHLAYALLCMVAVAFAGYASLKP